MTETVALEGLRARVTRRARNDNTSRRLARRKWQARGDAPEDIEAKLAARVNRDAWRRAVMVRHYGLPHRTQTVMADVLAATGRPAPRPLTDGPRSGEDPC